MTRRSAYRAPRIHLEQISITMARKRRSIGSKVDGKSDNKQAQVTAPKRTIKERGPTWSAPSKIQQTITQMTPSIYLPKPEYDGLTTDDDQEQESYIASTGRRKRRKVTPAKTSSRRTGTRSAQCHTITQMVPFRALYHPELEEENLDDLENEHKENNVPSPVKSRKRKVSPENAPSGKIQKRRQKQEKSHIEHQHGHGTESDERQPKKENTRSKQTSVEETLHPPVTPRSKRKEIPSSQSPAETPLSTRSRRSFRAYSRSPLKERSSNFAPATTSRRGGSRWGRKVEIADSMESREEESPVLKRASTSINSSGPENASGFGGKFSQLPTDSTVTRTAGLEYISDNWQWEETQRKGSNRGILRREIIDSDEENEDDDPDASLVGQARLHSKDTNVTQQRVHDNQRDRSRAARSSSSPQSQQQSNVRNHHSIERSRLSKHISTKPTPSPPSSNAPFPLTDSEQASARLFHDLHRVTEPTLETESQFEACWHSYHPPPASLPSSPPPQLPITSPSPSSPPPTNDHTNATPSHHNQFKSTPPSSSPFPSHNNRHNTALPITKNASIIPTTDAASAFVVAGVGGEYGKGVSVERGEVDG